MDILVPDGDDLDFVELARFASVVFRMDVPAAQQSDAEGWRRMGWGTAFVRHSLTLARASAWRKRVARDGGA